MNKTEKKLVSRKQNRKAARKPAKSVSLDYLCHVILRASYFQQVKSLYGFLGVVAPMMTKVK